MTRDVLELRRLAAKTLEQMNGRPGDPHSFDVLHRLLEAQVYRLAYLARLRRQDQLPAVL